MYRFRAKKNAFVNELAYISSLPASSFTVTKDTQGSRCYIYVSVSASDSAAAGAAKIFQAATDPSNTDLDTYNIVAFTSDSSTMVVQQATTGAPTAAPSTPAPTAPSTFTPVRINCGSKFAYNYNGVNFAADYQALPDVQGGTMYTVKNTVTGNFLIDYLRYFAFMVQGDGYHIAVPNGSYDVTMYWAETTDTFVVGSRTFQVMFEGVSMFGTIDVLVLSGGQYHTLVTKTATTTVTDGVLDITFAKLAQNPFVSAIEIKASAA